MSDMTTENPAPVLNRPEYEAIVVSDRDPDNNMRVLVRLLGLQDNVPEEELSWATYKLPVGHRPGDGDFMPAQVDDIVWVDFPYTSHGQPDTRRPRITGSVHYCPEGIPNFPDEAWRGPKRLQHKRTGRQPSPDGTGYHASRVFSVYGVTVEVEPNGVYRVTQDASGTAVEITKGGHIVLHSEGAAYFSSVGNMLFEVGGDLELHVKGDILERARRRISERP